MFQKLLIANRGEIAVRIARTAKALGIATVAVHSTQDAGALHVRVADERVDLGDGPASDNYLDGAKIIRAALDTGAEAIHPGYGFLSENAAFARAVDEAGLVFVGPSGDAISEMGEKVAARRVAVAAGVPLAPGSDGPVASADEVVAFGAEHGYPLLVKASHGGGGRGMRQIASAEEAADGFDAAVREATAAFGNGEVYVERYLVAARHIEVQVLADGHGNTVWLGDRDCSVQRRHQKLVEEAPAPGLADATRAAMGESAGRLAREVDYRGAGTVEFLVEDEHFYFLEMNTRIQVEHPVTEEVTGLDLIAEQLRIAAGEPMTITQSGPALDGWAVEARINAEDVAGGLFLPAPGPIDGLTVPSGPGVRFDAGYEAGDVVQASYDSLIGKLIAHGANRDEALDRLAAALRELRVDGVPTTAPAALAVIEHPDFRELRYTTNWLEQSVDFESIEDPADEGSRQEVEVGGRWYLVPVFADPGLTGGQVAVPAAAAVATAVATDGPRRASKRTRGGSDADSSVVTAPMQGTINTINVAVGDAVAKGTVLFVLEAMKMENPIRAPRDGVIAAVEAELGASVSAGTQLAALEEVSA